MATISFAFEPLKIHAQKSMSVEVDALEKVFWFTQPSERMKADGQATAVAPGHAPDHRAARILSQSAPR
jgi:hypothetical protein